MSSGLRSLLVASVLLALGGCGGGGGVEVVPGSGAPAAAAALASERELSFDLTFSAQLQRIAASDAQPVLNDPVRSAQNYQILALSPEVMSGHMLVENLDTGETESHPWRIHVGQNIFYDASSLTTLALSPGNYSFVLSVLNGDHQYVGTAFQYIADDSVNMVPMIIKPVIGDSIVDVSIEDSLVELGFEYDQSQIAAAGLQDPGVAISVDGGFQQFFAINPTTGLSDGLYFGLPAGNYDMSIELFDGGLLVGKSQPAQSTVSVSAGLDISLDIVPLYGQLQIDALGDGTDANVIVQVPADVVDEAGGLGNLDARLRVVGPAYAFIDEPVQLVPDGDGYQATVIMPSMTYEELTFELTFINMTNGALIGNCINTTANTRSGITATCQMLLHATSSIGGSLLSTVGVNVFDETGMPVPGAVISVDGVAAGITADSYFGTPGYSKLLLMPGEHSISASFASEQGELSYQSTPLGVDNIEIVLGESQVTGDALLIDDFSGQQTGLAAPLDYWYGCIGSGEAQAGVSGDQTMLLWSHDYEGANNYCYSASALTMHSFTDPQIAAAGGFVVSLDVLWSEQPHSEIAIGIGEELGNDPYHFLPSATADATVAVRDNEIEVRLYESGILVDSEIHATPIAASAIENIRIDVETDSFAAGSPAVLRVYLNDNGTFVPATAFNWDGGGNHIELRGGGGAQATSAVWVELDNLQVHTR